MKKILIFSLLALFYCFPLPTHFFTHVFGIPEFKEDTLGVLYSFWISHKFLFSIALKGFNPLVAAPFGVQENLQSGLMPVFNALKYFLSHVFNEVSAYNAFCILGIALSAYVVYVLVLRLTKNKWASIGAGLIYGFSPNMIVQGLAGHLGSVHAEWIPLFLLFLWKFFETASLWTGALGAVVFSVIFLSYPYYGYFSFFFALIWILYRFLFYEDKHSEGVKKMFGVLGMCLLSLVVTLPFIYKVVLAIFGLAPVSDVNQGVLVRDYGAVMDFGARIWDYFIPSELHPVFGSLSERLLHKLGGRHLFERNLYLGIIPLCLAVYGAFNWWKMRKSLPKEKSFFLSAMIVCGIGMMFLSFPPEIDLKVMKLYMPAHFLYKFFPMFRVYARAGVFVSLSVACLAGWGMKCLFEKFSRVRSRVICFSFLLLGLGFEYTVIPPIRNVDVSTVPPVYQWLRDEPGDFIIAEYPLFRNVDTRHYQYLSYQRFHQKRMMNGAEDRSPEGRFLHSNENLWESEVTMRLASLGIKYAIFHKEFYHKNIYQRVLKAEGLKLVKDFPEAFVFEVVAAPKDLTWVGMNAYLPEKGLVDKDWLWFSGDGGFLFYKRSAGLSPIQFKCLLTSFEKTRKVKIEYQGQEIIQYDVGPGQVKEVVLKDIALTQGLNVLSFKSDSGAQSNQKGQKVSVAFSDLKVMPDSSQ